MRLASIGAFSGAAIQTDRVTKIFPLGKSGTVWRLLVADPQEGFTALNDVSIAVPEGEFMGIIGLNGAGKSTLLRAVGGIYVPTRGVIFTSCRPTGIYELGIGGNELLSGREFSERWFDLNGVREPQKSALVNEVADFSELGEFFGREILTYSTGMRARLFFAVVTALPVDLVLIDEVLSVGDEHFQKKCWRRLREKIYKGMSGLLATHDWTAVLRLCRNVCVLERGCVVDQGPAREVVQRYLQLEAPTPRGARFGSGLPKRLLGTSGVDLVLDVPVEIDGEGAFALGFSIETFQPIVGWANIIHSDPQVFAAVPGSYEAEIVVPRLPLPAGTYSLNLFLVQRGPEAQTTVADVRS
ncbi:MAG: ABC transporter ATP-binding protein, partial [Pyrinomonadaceae bacterium]